MVAADGRSRGQAVSMRRAWRTWSGPRVLGTSVLLGLCVLVGCVLCILPGLFLGLLFSLIRAGDGRGAAATASTALTRARSSCARTREGGSRRSPLLKVFLIMLSSATC